MASEDDEPFTPLGRDMDRVEKVGWLLSLLWLIVAIISGIGEYRGWWELAGEIGLTVGTLASLLFGFASYLHGEKRNHLQRIYEAVRSTGDTLESVDVKLNNLVETEDEPEITDKEAEWEEIFEIIDEKTLDSSEEEIREEIKAEREGSRPDGSD